MFLKGLGFRVLDLGCCVWSLGFRSIRSLEVLGFRT